MPDELEVAVAVLRQADGRILVAQRAPWRHQGGRLEFPGGKIDPQETLAAALARELQEELGVRPLGWSPLVRVQHDYPDRRVILHACVVDRWSGEPHGIEGQEVYWHQPEALAHESFPAANRPILAALQYPDRYLITPDAAEVGVERVLEGLHAAVAHGLRLVQLRAPGLDGARWRQLLDQARAIAASAPAGFRLLANMGECSSLARYPELAGVHLSARAARRFAQRPVPADRLLACACHDRDEIRHAEVLEADFIVLGSVRATPTHPAGTPLGWDGLAQLTAQTALPAYAVGGLHPADIATARAHGAIGIAAIRGLWPGR